MRADLYLVEHGFFDTRARAQAAIAAGRVRVDGTALAKPSQKIPPGAVVEAEPAHPFVSRAALKLEAALDAFAIDPAGRACLDVGASTGGFSQVLLQRGAAKVYAVDVGRGQLHASLLAEPRLVNLEATDARTLTCADIDEPPALVVCDASFIALEKILPVPLSLAAEGAVLVALFKPQFEVGRDHVGKGGIVKDAAAVSAAKEKARAFLARAGWPVEAEMESPVAGGDGNVEYLFLARRAG
ncbi:TlyA family RNA methyltransferase [Marinicauda algicola]|uniref:TlyA family RNA methyltransferase n=1 Tax=Marinicauda algicola TaxID=2029849 RepID=A0A4S2GZ72_9PROT|nr:TlyA family RNA methyltransferase [Marinicauda algicola]TGY88495.1 TlyA family RNA methyltransferase [Marinicauda algicola]